MSLEDQKLLLKNYKLEDCPIDEYQPLLVGLDPTNVFDLMGKEFYNPNLFKAVECIVDAIIDQSVSRIQRYQRIKHWFKSPILIGEGHNAYALLIDLGKEPAFVLKVAKKSNTDILHELFVGLFGTNQLRKLVPNFTYLFGGFRCTYPVIDEKRVISYCEFPSNNVPYIIYENVAPAISLKEYLKSCSSKEYFEILLQHLFSFQLAYNEISFVHNDDHVENTLIRDLSRKYSIPYLIFDQGGVQGTPYLQGFLRTDKLAMSIDYGFSIIRYKGKYYGESLPEYGIFPDIPLPINDAFKFIFSSLYWMYRQGNMSCFEGTKKLSQFFGLPFMEPVIYKYSNNLGYFLSLKTKEKQEDFRNFISGKGKGKSKWVQARDFNYSDLINFVLNIYNPLKPPKEPIASCPCRSYQESLNFLFTSLKVETFYDFYDLSTSGKVVMFSDYEKAKQEYQEEQDERVEELEGIIPIIGEYHLKDMLDEKEKYKNNVMLIVSAYDTYNTINFNIKIGSYIAKEFDDKSLIKYVRSTINKIKEFTPGLGDSIKILREDVVYWKNRPKKLRKVYIWFNKVFPEIVKIFK